MAPGTGVFASLILLLMGALPSAGATTLRTGYYQAHGTAPFLQQMIGTLVYMGVEDVRVRTSNGQMTVTPAWHGSYVAPSGPVGDIFLEQAAGGALNYYYWDGKTQYAPGNLTKIPFGKDLIQIGMTSAGALTLTVFNGTAPETETYEYLGPMPTALNGTKRPGFQPSQTQWLAHRGFGGPYPENTIAAFDLALRSGFTGFEFDLRRTADGAWVVSHDDRLDIATNCGGSVRAATLAQFKTCTAYYSPMIPESKIGRAGAAVPVPVATLRQVLERFANDPRLTTMVFDIKERENIPDVVASLQLLLSVEFPAAISKVLLIGTTPDIALALQQAFPAVRVALEDPEGGYEILSGSKQSRYLNPPEFQGSVPAPRYLSINIGLGLAFDPDAAITQLPPILKTLIELPLRGGHIDLESLPWLCSQIQRLDSLMPAIHARHKATLAWEVYGPSKIGFVRSRYPDLNIALTNSPSWELARAQMAYALHGFHERCF